MGRCGSPGHNLPLELTIKQKVSGLLSPGVQGPWGVEGNAGLWPCPKSRASPNHLG